MNKKVIIGIAVVILLTAVLCVVLKIVIPSISGNKELELTYKTNKGVPYKWEYVIEDETIIEFVGTKDITSKEDKELLGGPVYTNYIFRGLKKGVTMVTFKYVSIIDGSIDKEEKLTVKVDKYKNISLNTVS